MNGDTRGAAVRGAAIRIPTRWACLPGVFAQGLSIVLTWLTVFSCTRSSNGASRAVDQTRGDERRQQIGEQRPAVPALPPDSVRAAVWREIHAPANMIH